MAMNVAPSSLSSTTSWMVTMLGWERMPALWASRMNRARNISSSRPWTTEPMWNVLSATRRPIKGSLAR
jgi:hypothetical protein